MYYFVKKCIGVINSKNPVSIFLKYITYRFLFLHVDKMFGNLFYLKKEKNKPQLI